MANSISIIIPILNEAENIGKLFFYLLENSSSKNIEEILVVDGGSIDGSPDIVTAFSADLNNVDHQIELIQSKKGRAKQMNVGAQRAKGQILYFLHADSLPPKNFDELILNEINNGYIAGCFRMKFNSKHPVLLVSQWFTRFNHKSCRGGDQSLFITKPLFEELKGYNENYIIFEDYEFIRRIYQKIRFRIIPKYLVTSARRYQQNGAWKLQYHFTVIHLKNWLGASAENLHKYYLKNIVS